MLRTKHMNHVHWKENQIQMRVVKKNMGIYLKWKAFLDHSLPYKSLEHIHYIDLAFANSWFLCKQDAISNKIPPKIKMNRLKFKFEIVEALSACPPPNKSILTDDEVNSAVVPLAKISKRYNPPAIHVMAFILFIPG
ncbi:uncharacterized protein TNCV_3696631 [Trichonephila clavipes]|uniref:Uncharacterized protein n=1 Tax=Trichonephila clavipes TaxID=2585209 RepID=A0A8X6SAS6_TRICX|nr:uncharacterized protein TNCV_3696631 [Trichonephila clavipes]